MRLPEELGAFWGVLLAAAQVLSGSSCFLLQSRDGTLRVFFASLVLMGEKCSRKSLLSLFPLHGFSST